MLEFLLLTEDPDRLLEGSCDLSLFQMLPKIGGEADALQLRGDRHARQRASLFPGLQTDLTRRHCVLQAILLPENQSSFAHFKVRGHGGPLKRYFSLVGLQLQPKRASQRAKILNPKHARRVFLTCLRPLPLFLVHLEVILALVRKGRSQKSFMMLPLLQIGEDK